MQWNNNNEGALFNRTKARISKNRNINDDTTWAFIPTSQIGATGSNPYTLSATGINSFSKFSIGDEQSPLPITLLNFTATYCNKTKLVYVKWSTINELNSDYFIIEKSTDNKLFYPVHQQAAVGFSNSTNNYQYTDDDLINEVIYYRLIQTDIDGKSHYSCSIAVITSTENTTITIMQLKQDLLLIQTNHEDNILLNVEILTLTGKKIFSETNLSNATNYLLNISKISSGIYIIRTQTTQQVYTNKYFINTF